MKRLILVSSLLIFISVISFAEETPVAAKSEEGFLVEGLYLEPTDLVLIFGGRDPDQGTGNNFSWTVNDTKRFRAYLSQESKVEVGFSSSVAWRSPAVEVGYDVYPKVQAYVSVSAGPFKVKITSSRKRNNDN